MEVGAWQREPPQPQALPSLAAWLRRHGQHVRRLAIGVFPDYLNEAWPESQQAVLATAQLSECLGACGSTARQLERLHVFISTPVVVGWAPLLPPSLRELGLHGERLVRVASSLGSLTQLTKLLLWSRPISDGSSVLFDSHASLPPSIRTLALAGAHGPHCVELPEQASWWGLGLVH